jgi:hypothetical protein
MPNQFGADAVSAFFGQKVVDLIKVLYSVDQDGLFRGRAEDVSDFAGHFGESPKTWIYSEQARISADDSSDRKVVFRGDSTGFQLDSHEREQHYRRNGGRRSLERTVLCNQFPITGKIQGIFSILVGCSRENASITLHSGDLLHSWP